MCGIAGFANLKGSPETLRKSLERMKDRMVHRGPDDEGSFFSDDFSVAMGFRRLSILDLSENGAQPMISHNGRYVITFNGEIYNHRDLLKRLTSEPALNISKRDFKGSSDTEILLEAVCAFGMEKALSLCKGMFGICVFDREENILYLARDRAGEKPLYYGFIKGAFVWASDLGSIAALDGFEDELNRDVLDTYFTYGYIPAPHTIYRNVFKLPPGQILTIRAPYRKIEKIRSYWDIRDVAVKGQKNLFSGSFTEAADELERLLKASVKDQLISDVPLGAFLSGGIDSATIVSLMCALKPEGSVRTFTIGTDDAKTNEAEFAKSIASHLGTTHTELYIGEDDAKAVIPKLSSIFAEPFADYSQIPTYLVAAMTRQHVTVSLSGDAGDELFCGYIPTYDTVSTRWNRVNTYPAILRRPVSFLIQHSPLSRREYLYDLSLYHAAKDPEDVYNRFHRREPASSRISLSHIPECRLYQKYEPDATGEFFHNLMLMDMCQYLPDDILVKVDRTAMAVSLETRIPMLDRDVVEFAWTLPIEYLRDGKEGKKVLREVLYRYVPKEMMDRPKTGFSVPIHKWLREDKNLREWAEGLIDPARLKKEGILNAFSVEMLWRRLQDAGIWAPQIWYILMFLQWFADTSYPIS
ncbi:MAG: asparagine synthase (glutamine-hydrolyzing) [Lachnospiraceae bacterium]|nr:asparagine synthase (glutamine-hydrolyzing) [Lachnospiraceae bacterium]